MKLHYFTLATAMLILLAGCGDSDDPIIDPNQPKKEEENPKKEEEENKDKPDLPPPIDAPEIVTASHYILTYIKSEPFTASVSTAPFIVICYDFLNGTYYFYRHEQESELHPQEAAAYTAICERYNDLTYAKTRTFYYFYSPDRGYCYLIDNIVSINVICSTDYDQAHPAGALLNDICDLVYYSPRDYIASGYTDTYDWSVYPDYLPPRNSAYPPVPGVNPYCKPLTECTPEDMVLMGDGRAVLCMLRLTHRPTSGLKQRFVVTLTDERGELYTVATDECKW